MRWLTAIFLVFFIQANITHAQTAEFVVNDVQCSGFVAKLSSESQTAYLFTAGHCIPGLMDENDPDRRFQKIPVPVTKFRVHYTDPQGIAQVSTVESQELELASLQNVDIAILKLDKTVKQLEAEEIRPFLVRTNVPHSPEVISIRNALSGEHASCKVENSSANPFIRKWHLNAGARLAKDCRMGHGWSGSPIINETGDVIGILNGGNDTGRREDFHEFDDNGQILIFKNQGYFSYLNFLIGCTNENGMIQSEKCVLGPMP